MVRSRFFYMSKKKPEQSNNALPVRWGWDQGGAHAPTFGVREKLIIIFLLVKVLPLVLLAYIAWISLVSLGTILRETATRDAQIALTRLARENIERVSTDAAQKIAEFLYQRDADISFLARQASPNVNDEGKRVIVKFLHKVILRFCNGIFSN